MNVMAMNADALEGNLFARNNQASAVGSAFENVVKATIVAAMCSDCCGSNGNSCTGQTPQQ